VFKALRQYTDKHLYNACEEIKYSIFTVEFEVCMIKKGDKINVK